MARRHRIRLRPRAFGNAAAQPGSAMSGALTALALALVMTPAGCRRRLETLGLLVPARRRFPVLPCAAAVAAAMAIVLPVSVAAACSSSVHAVDAQEATGSAAAPRRRIRGTARRIGCSGRRTASRRPSVAAFSVAASEVDGAVAASLRAVAARARLGADVAAGLRSFARSSSLSAHWERLAVFWQLAQDHGLAIATLMRAAHRDIVERERFSARVDAGMAGARTTAAVLAGLPVTRRRPRPADRGRSGDLPAVRRGGRLAVGRRRDAGLRRAAVVGSHHRAGVDMSWAALLLAAALLIGADSGRRSGRGWRLCGRDVGQRRRLRVIPSPPRRPSTCSRRACVRGWRCRPPRRRPRRRPRGTGAAAQPCRRPVGAGRRTRRGMVEPGWPARQRTAKRCSGWPGGRRRREPRWPKELRSWPTSHATRRPMRRAPPRAGLGADRRATRLVLPACLRVPGHRPDRRRAGR